MSLMVLYGIFDHRYPSDQPQKIMSIAFCQGFLRGESVLLVQMNHIPEHLSAKKEWALMEMVNLPNANKAYCQ